MLRLAIVGDVHLQEKSHRFEHTLDVLDWIIDDFQQSIQRFQGDAGAVFCGDISEGNPSPREYFQFIRRLNRLDGVLDNAVGHYAIGIVRGNHESLDAVSVFELLGPSFVVADSKFERMEFMDARVLLVPYPRRGHPPFDAMPGVEASIQDSFKASSDIIAAAIQRQASELSLGPAPVLVVGHFTIEGMTTRDTEFEQHHGTEVVVPRSSLAGATLVAVGHVHRPQEWRNGTWIDPRDSDVVLPVADPVLLGVGSIIRNSFSEAEDKKSYTIVTMNQRSLMWERRSLPVRDMVEIHVGFDDAAEQIEQLAAAIPENKAEIKVVLSLRDVDRPLLNESIFAPLRDRALHFAWEPKTTSTQRVRAPQVSATAQLKHQFDEWAKATGLQIEKDQLVRINRKLDGLEAIED